MQLPSLFDASDRLSNERQARYLNLIRGQYGALILAASALAFYPSIFFAGVAYLVLVLAALILSLWLLTTKPEKDWYQFRALAESIKTRAWMYAVGAEPFPVTMSHPKAVEALMEDIAQILASNSHARDKLTHINASASAVSDDMRELRSKALKDRRQRYIDDRVNEQCFWYEAKVKTNKRHATLWGFVISALYVVAFALILDGLIYRRAEGFLVSPAILLVTASAIVGWMQIKKFNELAAAYSLTAHEISLARERLKLAKTEHDFSNIVDEIELVFSREHTQWVARQQS